MRHALTLFTTLALLGAVPFAVAGDGYVNDPAHHVYDESRDAEADVEAAFARARLSGKRVLVVFGANWCHDSRGLVRHFQTSEISEFVEANFETVWVDVDTPQMGMGRNLELAAALGQDEVVGTPTVVLLDPMRVRINRQDTATAWRNSDSRTTDEVLAELKSYAEWDFCYPMPVSAGEGEPFIAADCSTHTRP